MGRLVHPSFLDGQPPVSSSATTAPYKAHTYDGRQPYTEARALGVDEIPGVIEDYANATRLALAAGFDGVQIHAANGYLIDQFLRESANLRADDYGGSIENRIRLLGEVTRAVADIAGPDRTAVRLSPNGESQGVNDSDPDAVFGAAGRLLDEIGIAFLELREPTPDGTFGKAEVPPVGPAVRRTFSRPLVLNSDYTLARAQAALDAGVADAISFGRPFISNPDLVERLAAGLPLTPDDQATWYSQEAEGYTSYPRFEAAAA
jgi:2,4-dienoyl-CoA reductase-like NADH-dependent reductase (Old Yellow Enzyme family)